MVRLLLVSGVVIVLGAVAAIAVPNLRSMPEAPVVVDEPSVLEEFEATDKIGGLVGNLAPEFAGISHWINSEPLRMEELRGKVVLIDFWTYTCVNCIRTMPFLRDWQAKYADLGLVIVGVHTPEFEFEKITDNVRAATNEFGLDYPVAQDNEFGTWRVFGNQFWPAKYLIDANGVVRYTHFGEGG
ncbi:MAG: redoxin domain-containing protein, partial [Chloroflexi bacterium]|nr:redoxin domain-containing protein [Chloroflexota bacterium]